VPDPIWLVLWAACLALLAGLFGAIAGAVTWWRGQRSGTALGKHAAKALARVADTDFSPPATGSIVGATDGLLLSMLVIVPALLLPPTRALLASPEFRLPSLLLPLVLGTIAILLGSLAHLLEWARGSGLNAVGGFVCAFLVVAVLAGRAHVGDPMLLGLLAGAVVAPLAAWLLKPGAARPPGSRD
jgi:hypothetical protein